ncbi:50S ribosomal protein L4 [Candidatus Woesearchaeota archaeon CG1_02_57_44]|nr:MAG: 50S ribosomal protein L4 [Candidatus Woesearchaeota archaeon CG1_02_57_44]
MKLPLLGTDGKEQGSVTLPAQFQEPINAALVKKAVLATESRQRQPYGSSPEAGMQQSTKLSRRRRDYKGSYGHGISRVPRKVMSGKGSRLYWVGALAPGTVGGRRAHPPKSFKNWAHKINVKERRKAIRSAIAATVQIELVKANGHKVPKVYPFIFVTDIEAMAKTADVVKALQAAGLKDELARITTKGFGKGPLLVVSGPCKAIRAARNIKGVDVVTVKQLNAQVLAPSRNPGRLTIFTKTAIEAMEGLFA